MNNLAQYAKYSYVFSLIAAVLTFSAAAYSPDHRSLNLSLGAMHLAVSAMLYAAFARKKT